MLNAIDCVTQCMYCSKPKFKTYNMYTNLSTYMHNSYQVYFQLMVNMKHIHHYHQGHFHTCVENQTLRQILKENINH